MKLNQLRDNEGARKNKMTVGRGIGSGKGKTSGRGVKGQKARSGVSIKGFEGGQMPLHRRLPKRGFKNIFANDYAELTLNRLQAALDSGVLTGADFTSKQLMQAGVTSKARDGVRLIAKGDVKGKFNLTIEGATKGAVKAIEKAGGKVTIFTRTVAPIKNGKVKGQKAAARKAAAEAKGKK
ncbi:MAG: 50S ribosomal protein L15 [Bdellovibrionales bacterium]